MAARNKKRRKPENRAKFKFLCTAPEHLTEYNISLNEKVHEECIQEIKFQPELTCAFDHKEGRCPYLETTKL